MFPLSLPFQCTFAENLDILLCLISAFLWKNRETGLLLNHIAVKY